jgi:hypothetical protein
VASGVTLDACAEIVSSYLELYWLSLSSDEHCNADSIRTSKARKAACCCVTRDALL